MTESLPSRLANALVAVVPENPDAVENLRNLYAAHLIFQDPIQRLQGVDAFLEMNRHLLRRMKKLSWEILSTAGNENEAFLEWKMLCTPRLGPTVEVAGVTRARAKNGKIFDHRDYWDVGELFASAVPGGMKLLHLVRAPLA